MDWFQSLNKPALQPPDWLFMPVWIVLYIMITLSLLFFLRKGITRDKIIPLIFYFAQWILNISWSGVFFGMQNPDLALIIILAMLIFIILTIITFYKYSKTAAFLLVPYLLWVCFASYINYEIVKLN